MKYYWALVDEWKFVKHPFGIPILFTNRRAARIGKRTLALPRKVQIKKVGIYSYS